MGLRCCVSPITLRIEEWLASHCQVPGAQDSDWYTCLIVHGQCGLHTPQYISEWVRKQRGSWDRSPLSNSDQVKSEMFRLYRPESQAGSLGGTPVTWRKIRLCRPKGGSQLGAGGTWISHDYSTLQYVRFLTDLKELKLAWWNGSADSVLVCKGRKTPGSRLRAVPWWHNPSIGEVGTGRSWPTGQLA